MLVPTSPGSPPPPHSGQAVLVTTSLREAGWVVTAAPPASVVCRLHVDFWKYGSLEQRSVAASAIFNVPTRSSHWLCLAVRRRSFVPPQAGVGPLLSCQHTILLQKLSVQKGLYVPLYVPAGREALSTRQVREATITEKASQAAQA